MKFLIATTNKTVFGFIQPRMKAAETWSFTFTSPSPTYTEAYLKYVSSEFVKYPGPDLDVGTGF
jgi:hypothetical protein